MKYLLILFLICASCGSKEIPVVEGREMNGHFVVDTIEGDSARLLTLNYRIPYYVESEGLEVGEKAFFMLFVLDPEIPKEYNARIRKAIPSDDTTAIRRALMIDRHIKFNKIKAPNK